VLNIDGCRVPGEGAEGRWPANLVFTHAPGCGDGCAPGCPVAALEEQARGASRFFLQTEWCPEEEAPFFYCAKPSTKERNEGCGKNDHPTLKPLELMRYLVRLVTPPGGTVLDPFLGSGTTALACLEEGLSLVGMEQDEHYLSLAVQRLKARAERLGLPFELSLLSAGQGPVPAGPLVPLGLAPVEENEERAP
jgi:site-specific DNA-methyltransferase (adenine-specific)